MKTIEIKHRYTNDIIFSHTCENNTIKLTVLEALKNKVSLAFSKLSNCDLSNSNLSYLNLQGADFSYTNFSDCNFSHSIISYCSLYGCNFQGCTFSSSYLTACSFLYSDFSYCKLSYCNIFYCDFAYSTFSYCSFEHTAMTGVNINYDSQIKIHPDGAFIGWKKCRGDAIVKLLIPAESRRSNYTNRMLRAEFVKVLEVYGADRAISRYDKNITYSVGEIVRCDKWDERWWMDCPGGTHFFLTKKEAQNY